MKALYRHHRNRSIRAAATLVWVTLMLSPAPGLAATPAIYNLGTPGGTGSYGVDVNDAGQVAGHSYSSGSSVTHAFRYDGIPGAGGVMRDLGTLGGTNSYGYYVNNAGQVAGQSQITGSVTHAFRYDGTPGSGGVMRDLGTLGGTSSEGYGVNNAGQVAGRSHITGFEAYHAFRYDGTPGAGGIMRDLGTLGGTDSHGRGINDAGQVTGYSHITGNMGQHAFRYDGTPGAGGIMRDLGTLGGGYSEGFGVNNAGQVAGYSFINGHDLHAFRYDGTPGAGGIMRDLGALGGSYSYGFDVNDAGQVAGFSYLTGNTAAHAFLYTGTPGVDGQMLDLDIWLNANNPTEGAKWTLLEARGVSNTGWITGGGIYDPDGPGGVAEVGRAYLLDASTLVPEPSNVALFSVAGLALARRRRRSIRSHCCEALEQRRLLSSNVVAADFNYDERLDLATLYADASYPPNGSVKVWLGNGAGGFSAPRQFAVAGYPNSLAVADFNNDGSLDLATGNIARAEVIILLGDGDGTFQTAYGVYWGNVPMAVAVGHFNADNNIDLVAIEQADWDPDYCGIAIQLGNGQGGFTPASRYRIREIDDGLVAADLNNDGELDVLTSDGQILPGNGDGTLNYTYPGSLFLDPAGPSHAHGLVVGDFTGEGMPDVIVGREALDVVPGLGNFAFAPPSHHNSSWRPYVETADFNGDGKLDAASADLFLQIWLGNGDGTLRNVEEVNTGGGGFAVGDFNGDGRPDLAGPSGDSVWVRLNDGVWPGNKTFVGPGGSGSGGNWCNPGNWSPPGVPAAGDHVSIAAGKSVNLGGSATVASLTLSGGATLSLEANANRVLRTSNLTIGGTSKLNLNDNDLIVDYTGASPIASIQALLASGYNGGAWNGNGIITSLGNAGNLGIGYAESATLLGPNGGSFGGQSVDGHAVLLRFTFYGDNDLDRDVDLSDLGKLASNYGGSFARLWIDGDFDYDGDVDLSDMGRLSTNFGAGSISGVALTAGDASGPGNRGRTARSKYRS